MKQRLRDIATRGLNAIWYGGNPICWLLWPAHILVRGLVAMRRLAYRLGLLPSVDPGVPVIVVGNLSVGGTGKTPLTIWLAGQLTARRLRVGIVCSGYGGKAERWPQPVTPDSDAGSVGDEACLLAQRTGCPVAAGRDRAAAAALLKAQDSLDLILCDDGLQHYRLRRMAEIAVVDGTRGLGNGLCLPAGPLREPGSRLKSVDVIVVNDGDFGHAGVVRTSTEACGLIELATGAERSLAEFAGRRVHAVAAIGNPARFFDLLERAGLEVEPHAHADHARLSPGDLRFDDDAPVMITEKDAVKCPDLEQPDVFSVMTELKFRAGDDERLLGVLERLQSSGVANQ